MNSSRITGNVPIFLVEGCADVNTHNNIFMSFKNVQERLLRISANMRNFDKFEDSSDVEASSAARCTLSIMTTEVGV